MAKALGFERRQERDILKACNYEIMNVYQPKLGQINPASLLNSLKPAFGLKKQPRVFRVCCGTINLSKLS